VFELAVFEHEIHRRKVRIMLAEQAEGLTTVLLSTL
jgi:hypothetical protein